MAALLFFKKGSVCNISHTRWGWMCDHVFSFNVSSLGGALLLFCPLLYSPRTTHLTLHAAKKNKLLDRNGDKTFIKQTLDAPPLDQ